MTISNSTSRKILLTATAVAISALPTCAFAAVHITDTMYDPPGSDQGHEWIEITNTGTEPVSLLGYRLYEGGTNHKLVVAQGTSTLAAGAKAIIATDPTQYKADHGAFAGLIFKSSFSLSNSGETIELKDASLSVVDTYSYTAPVVVKAPAVKKTSTKSSSSVSTNSSGYSYTKNDQAAALPLSNTELPSVAIPSGPWLYGAGLVCLLILGAAAALYIRPNERLATSSREGEFELE